MAKSGFMNLFMLSGGGMYRASWTRPETMPGMSRGTAMPSLYMMIPGLTRSAAAWNSRLDSPRVSRTTPSASSVRSMSSMPAMWSSCRVLESQGL